MKKENWIWMPYAGHFILGDECNFRLNTYVGKYIVSTIGELWGDSQVRKIHAQVHDKEWYAENKDLKGDNFDVAYFKKFGFQEIGYKRLFETMVFEAKPNPDKKFKDCVPYVIDVTKEVDFNSYDDRNKAYKGHLKLCEKWCLK